MTPSPEVRIVIACDEMIVRAALASLISREFGFAVVGGACDGATAIEQVLSLRPDILLLHLPLTGPSAFKVLARLKKDSAVATTSKSILISGNMSRFEVFEALELGARGIVTRQVTPSLLSKGIHCVAAGEYWVTRNLLVEWLRSRGKGHDYQLTKRERQIVHKVLTGASNKKIGSSCGITEATASRHLANIYKKLGVSRRSDLITYAVNHQL